MTFISSSFILYDCKLEAPSITTTAVHKNKPNPTLGQNEDGDEVTVETAAAADVEDGDPAAASSLSLKPKVN